LCCKGQERAAATNALLEYQPIRLKERSESLQNSPLFKIGGTPVLKIDEQTREFPNTIFRKMIDEQKSDYTYKDDLIRNYINLIIYEALKLQPSEHYDRHKNASSRLTSVFLELLESQFPVEGSDNPLQLKTPRLCKAP
jgi:AraC family transcriptional activator of pobA